VNRRLLIATAALATVGWGSCEMANATAATACGGNSSVHVAPIDCVNTATVGGVTGGIHLTVNTSGSIHVDAQVSNKTVVLFLQVKAHDGISSNGSFFGATAVFANGLASADTQIPNCLSQIDIKIVPGAPTLDHVSDIYRVAAPLVELPNCGTTTTTTVPQSSTTLPPSTSTSAPPPTTTPDTASTAPSTSPPSTTGGGGAHSKLIPATGRDNTPLVLLGVVFVGLGVLVLEVRRRAS